MDFWKSPKKTIKAQNEPTLCVIEQKSVAHTYKVLYINKTFVITLPCRVVKKPGPTKTFYFIMFLTLFLLQTLIKHSFFLNAAGIVNFDYEASFKYIYIYPELAYSTNSKMHTQSAPLNIPRIEACVAPSLYNF